MLLYIVQVGFWIELPVQRRLCSILLNFGFQQMGHNGMVSSYTISTGILLVDG